MFYLGFIRAHVGPGLTQPDLRVLGFRPIFIAHNGPWDSWKDKYGNLWYNLSLLRGTPWQKQ